MKRVLLILLLLCPLAHATTWYIRSDGGTATQCTGLVNAPYPGSGSAQPCAVNHPFWLLDQTAWTWLISANDTVQFMDTGPYYMGQQTGGHGQFWQHCSGGEADCDLPPLPTGVKLYGVNQGSCHNSAHSALVNPTRLIGINFIFYVIDLEGSQSPDVECFDLSSLTTCTSQGKSENLITNTAMTNGVATYSWTFSGSDQIPALGEAVTITGTTNGGGVFNVNGGIITSITGTTSGTFTIGGLSGTVASAADTGTQYFTGRCDTITVNSPALGIVLSRNQSQGPSNATLRDIAVHGMRTAGIYGTKLNTTPADVFTASDLIIAGNGDAGWDADGGNCGTSCESQGTMNISHITSMWNGCVEVQPNGGTIGGNGYNYCVDQAFAGNGDGLVMIATGGTWNWSDVLTEYNTQDGFDSLHVGDDPVTRPTLNATRIYAMGNEGQSIKGGGGQATITNSVGIANCNVFAVAANFPANPTGWNALTQQRCRANDMMAFAMQDGDRLTIEYVDNIGENDVAWDMSTGGCTTNCVVTFKNNVTMGFIDPFQSVYPGAFYYAGANPFDNASSATSNNSWYHIGSSGTTCPGDSHETNFVCTDPLLTAESDVNAINPLPTAQSPLLGAGVAISGITTDYLGNVRPNPPAIGAYELGGSPPTTYTTYLGGAVKLSGNIHQ